MKFNIDFDWPYFEIGDKLVRARPWQSPRNMTGTKILLVCAEEIFDSFTPVVGVKNLNLQEIKAARIDVPEFFILTPIAHPSYNFTNPAQLLCQHPFGMEMIQCADYAFSILQDKDGMLRIYCGKDRWNFANQGCRYFPVMERV